MTREQITENNKLIVVFMGLTPLQAFGKFSISQDHCTSSNDTAEEAVNGFASIAKYATDWNWLMPVIEKIEKVSITEDFYSFYASISTYGTTIAAKTKLGAPNFDYTCERFDKGTKLENTFEAVYWFIKWYDEIVYCSVCNKRLMHDDEAYNDETTGDVLCDAHSAVNEGTGNYYKVEDNEQN